MQAGASVKMIKVSLRVYFPLSLSSVSVFNVENFWPLPPTEFERVKTLQYLS